MTDRELTKAVIAIYRKACNEMKRLINAQGVSVYTCRYGMRRWFKHGDNSSKITSGYELMHLVESNRVTLDRKGDNMLAQATPKAVEKLKNKIIKDIVEENRRAISRAGDEIVKSETRIRELVKSGKISEKSLRRIIQKEERL